MRFMCKSQPSKAVLHVPVRDSHGPQRRVASKWYISIAFPAGCLSISPRRSPTLPHHLAVHSTLWSTLEALAQSRALMSPYPPSVPCLVASLCKLFVVCLLRSLRAEELAGRPRNSSTPAPPAHSGPYPPAPHSSGFLQAASSPYRPEERAHDHTVSTHA